MYLWMKWLHILAIISWMAGILYLYRLLVNHRDRGLDSPAVHELLCGMEYRLFRYITLPAMIVAIIAGFMMIYLSPDLLKAGWMHTKILFVLVLIHSTFKAKAISRRAAADPKTLPSSRTLRILNEVPTILMMIIVGLVVFKAF